MNRKITLILGLLPIFTFLNGCGNKNTFYNIEWRNYDQSILDSSIVKAGEIPEYHGVTPTRDKDAQYSYSFNGWSPQISPASHDTTYVATYSTTTNKYTVTWKNYDGSVLEIESYSFGDTPVYKGSTPIREKDAQYSYSFNGWSPQISPVSNDTTYIADYSAITNKYTVTWKNYDGSVLEIESYSFGDTPVYKGSTPIRESSDEDYYYAFLGWDNQIVNVTENCTYTAKFSYSYGYDMELVNNIYYKIKKCYLTESTRIRVPSKYNNLPVYSIKTNAFSGCEKLKSLIIGNNIQEIELNAFGNCNSIETMTLPFVGGSRTSNKFLGYLFGSKDAWITGTVPKSLKEVILSNICTSISAAAFAKCSYLTSVVIPGSVTSIGGGAFSGCSSLSNVVFKGPLINWLSLQGKSNLSNGSVHLFLDGSETETTSILIPDSSTFIDSYAFYNCSSLASIAIPDSVTSIGVNAFYNCTSLASLSIPDSVTSIGDYAFYNCSSLISITIPDSVTSIGVGAFSNCSSLESMSLPFIGGSQTSNQYLGYIFGYTQPTSSSFPSSLTEVILSNNCTSIGDYAFYHCYSLTSITIPDSVTSIGGFAFAHCSSLKSITIPDSVTSIGVNAFAWCYSLEKIIFKGSLNKWLSLQGKENITNASVHLFLDGSETETTSIIIPENTTTIDSYAFYKCASLKSITIPDSVTSIGADAFCECSSLASFAIPDNVTSIGGFAFAHCSSLKSITIPDSVTSIGKKAFFGCSSLLSIIFKGSLINWLSLQGKSSLINASVHLFLDGSETETTSIIIPENTTTIDSYAFIGCSSLTSITIPDSVTSIGSYAFSSCSLTSIVIPDSVTSIGKKAFFGCSSLLSIIFKGSLINWLSLQGKSSLINASVHLFLDGSETETTSIIIPENTTTIDSYAFIGCSSLTSITIPDSVTSIGDYAFYHCSSLTSITIPDSVTSIGEEVFSNCSSLLFNVFDNCLYLGNNKNPFLVLIKSANWEIETCNINGSCRFISSNFSSFNKNRYCYLLTSVNIPDSVTSIGKYAFSNCSHLTSISIPDSVTSIGEKVFLNCYSLKSMTLPFIGGSKTSNQYFSYLFGGYKNVPTSLKEIILTNNCTSIDDVAFSECSSLTSIVIPDSVTSIGNYAFDNCSSLTSIVIPKNVLITQNAFYGCESLAIVYYHGTQSEWDNDYKYRYYNVTYLNKASVFYYSEFEPTEPGYYWHYVNGTPIVW